MDANFFLSDNSSNKENSPIIKSQIEIFDSNDKNIPQKRRKRRKKLEIEQDKKKVLKPYFRKIRGQERLCLMYDIKPSNYKTNYQNPEFYGEPTEFEYCLRFNIQNVNIDELSDKFKRDNCVYKRAHVPPEKYKGTRFGYETECNKVAWRFVYLNRKILYGRKFLLQRVVDAYRHVLKFYTHCKIQTSINEDSYIYSIRFGYNYLGIYSQYQMNAEIENINFEAIPDNFKRNFSVFVKNIRHEDFEKDFYENYEEDNVLAIKLAYVNNELPIFWDIENKNPKTRAVLREAVEVFKRGRFCVKINE